MNIFDLVIWYILSGLLLYGAEIILFVAYTLINYKQFNVDKMSSITASDCKTIKSNNLLKVVLLTIILWPIIIPKSLLKNKENIDNCMNTK